MVLIHDRDTLSLAFDQRTPHKTGPESEIETFGRRKHASNTTRKVSSRPKVGARRDTNRHPRRTHESKPIGPPATQKSTEIGKARIARRSENDVTNTAWGLNGDVVRAGSVVLRPRPRFLLSLLLAGGLDVGVDDERSNPENRSTPSSAHSSTHRPTEFLIRTRKNSMRPRKENVFGYTTLGSQQFASPAIVCAAVRVRFLFVFIIFLVNRDALEKRNTLVHVCVCVFTGCVLSRRRTPDDELTLTAQTSLAVSPLCTTGRWR